MKSRRLIASSLICIGLSTLSHGSFLVQINPLAVQKSSLHVKPEHNREEITPDEVQSRRRWLQTSAVAIVGGTSAIMAPKSTFAVGEGKTPTVSPQKPKAELAPVNITKVVSENTINVTLKCPEQCVQVDRKTFNKVRIRDYPSWWPDALRRRTPSVVREYTNSELLVASAVAGASMDLVRTTVAYPLLTTKTRIQAVANKRRKIKHTRRRNWIKRRLQIVYLTFRRQAQEKGNLYAGLLPTLLVSVPATAVYYGTRDITKRMLNKMVILSSTTTTSSTKPQDIAIALTAALLADVVSLAARTPADTLSLRLQVLRGQEGISEEAESELVGDWVADSIERLPAVIKTDLPYLLMRIALNMAIASGDEDVANYELLSITTACTCALLTTPFDVARTRILVDSDGDPENGLDGGSRQGVRKTMQRVIEEGDGGVGNLFAGWFERTAYLGLGKAWLDPITVLGYTGIRDAILLKVFD